MKIALDTNPLYTGRGGVARYVQGLLQGLAGPGGGLEVSRLAWEVENLGYAQPARALRTLAREWGWAKWVAPRRLGGVQVLHHTALPVIPFVKPVRHVVTLHDLAVVRHPERFRPWQRQSGLRRLRRVVRADRVICVSRFTADEAMRGLGLPAARLEVIHHGGLLAGVPSVEPLADLPEDYFLFVGSLEPGKNLALLRDIYRAATEPLPPLVVAGARWEGVAHEGAPPSGWYFLGAVDDARLHGLYRRARALLFPSRYEGFGLPLVEAMQLGCPVLCGPVASLPEVGGDAVAYAELNPDAYGRAMRRLVTDTAWREQLTVAGRERGGQFSWERCGRETAMVYAALVTT
ncbi:MAG: glycosyltransferase family 4 protein [Opitutae bacterium]|nr:glycosyltransferase family 4 protein [Opitutae bacterium]